MQTCGLICHLITKQLGRSICVYKATHNFQYLIFPFHNLHLYNEKYYICFFFFSFFFFLWSWRAITLCCVEASGRLTDTADSETYRPTDRQADSEDTATAAAILTFYSIMDREGRLRDSSQLYIDYKSLWSVIWFLFIVIEDIFLENFSLKQPLWN